MKQPERRLPRSVASLRIAGELLEPDVITSLLGAAPTRAHKKGERRILPSGKPGPSWQSGLWACEATESPEADGNRQIHEILDRLTADLAIWRDIGSRFDMDVFFGFFMGESNDGCALSVEAMQRAAARGIRIDIDIYAPDKRRRAALPRDPG